MAKVRVIMTQFNDIASTDKTEKYTYIHKEIDKSIRIYLHIMEDIKNYASKIESHKSIMCFFIVSPRVYPVIVG